MIVSKVNIDKAFSISIKNLAYFLKSLTWNNYSYIISSSFELNITDSNSVTIKTYNLKCTFIYFKKFTRHHFIIIINSNREYCLINNFLKLELGKCNHLIFNNSRKVRKIISGFSCYIELTFFTCNKSIIIRVSS